MLSLQVATVSVQVRCFDHEDLRQLQNRFVTDEDLCGQNVLLALKLLLRISLTALELYDLLLVDCAPQETLVAMAKAVASSTAALVANARTVAAKCDDQALQNQVIGAAKATALATQALIACTKVLSPTIDNPLCQEQLIEACKLVAAAVERIVIAAQVGRVLQ